MARRLRRPASAGTCITSTAGRALRGTGTHRQYRCDKEFPKLVQRLERRQHGSFDGILCTSVHHTARRRQRCGMLWTLFSSQLDAALRVLGAACRIVHILTVGARVSRLRPRERRMGRPALGKIGVFCSRMASTAHPPKRHLGAPGTCFRRSRRWHRSRQALEWWAAARW